MAGRIVFLKLKNFMSYDSIELHPGPHLNLIIGPNGTGKSTFVCAVVLGMGGKLKTLGRGDQISSYIKNGRDESIIDIELYEPDEENVHITRKIYPNNHSDFLINGKHASASKVSDLRNKYNIHLDNMCTFLPQEKVQDFSRLNPQQLLSQTQKAVGSEEIIAAHDQLKNLLNSLKEKEVTNTDMQKKIDTEREKNDRIKDKVKSYYEKQALREKLTLINQKKSWLCYQNELLSIENITKDLKLAEEQCAKKKEVFTKFLLEFELSQNRVKTAEKMLSKCKLDCDSQKSIVRNTITKLYEKIGFVENFDKTIQEKLAEVEAKKDKLKEYQEKLDKLSNDLRSFEESNGTDEQLTAEEEDAAQKLNECAVQEMKLTEKRASLEDELEKVKVEMNNLLVDYRLLERRNYFRLEFIRRSEPDIYKAMEWLKQNRQIFQGLIYNPMLLEIDVMDIEMAKYVENHIGYNDLISFTCTSSDDLNLLIQKLRKERNLKINVVCSEEDGITQYQPQIPINQISSLGFVAYLKDVITGPDHIINFLCKVYNIHCVPIGNEQVESNCEKVPASIPIFFSENHAFTVKTSVYSGAKSIHVKELKRPKILLNPLENVQMQRLQERQKELEATAKNVEKKIKDTESEFKPISLKIDCIRQKKRELVIRREDKKLILFNIKSAEENILCVQNSLQDPAEILREAEEKINKMKKDVNQHFCTLTKSCKILEKISYIMQENEIKFKASILKVTKLEDLKANGLSELKKSEVVVNHVKTVKRNVENTCKQLREEVKKLTNGISPGEVGFKKFEKQFEGLPNTTEELEKEAEDIRVRCSLLYSANAEMVQEYENRENAITKMEAALNWSKNELENTEKTFSELWEKWLSPMRELASRINEIFGNFFEKMECAGEVSLVSGQNERDVDQYGIVVKVKFRDDIPLQSLGRHFQSGGERAVTTAVYLLALQKLISVPFRFVDEINQGMDIANEQRIMNLMMSVTEDGKSSQYFFITPKLLPNVKCSDTIVTHCIYSGPTIPFDTWNMQSFLSSADKENV